MHVQCELEDLGRKISDLPVERAQVIFNNNYEDQGQRNARTLQGVVGGFLPRLRLGTACSNVELAKGASDAPSCFFEWRHTEARCRRTGFGQTPTENDWTCRTSRGALKGDGRSALGLSIGRAGFTSFLGRSPSAGLGVGYGIVFSRRPPVTTLFPCYVIVLGKQWPDRLATRAFSAVAISSCYSS